MVRAVDLEAYAVMDKEVREYFPHAEARKYQASLANEVYRSLLNGDRNIVVECPTGLGKARPFGLLTSATFLTSRGVAGVPGGVARQPARAVGAVIVRPSEAG